MAGTTVLSMKTVTVEQLQSTLPDLLRLVARGQEIRAMHRKRAVARIVPAGRGTAPVDWTSTWSKVNAIFDGKPAPGKPGSQIIVESRR
jgi:antitoxin (DNA-binding transcriptional repressor) of toxin-antitoxin stability system